MDSCVFEMLHPAPKRIAGTIGVRLLSSLARKLPRVARKVCAQYYTVTPGHSKLHLTTRSKNDRTHR